jgi:hypothetical protein
MQMHHDSLLLTKSLLQYTLTLNHASRIEVNTPHYKEQYQYNRKEEKRVHAM